MSDAKTQAMMKQAFLLDRQGNGSMAVMLWRKILLAHPDHVPSIYYMADVLFRLGRLSEAEAALRVALERASGEAHIWVLLGKVLTDWGEGSLQEAEECFHNAIARNPDSPEGQIGLGEFYLSQQRVMEAMAAFQMAADKAPDNPKALRGLGEGWWQRGQMEEALRCFREAHEKAPDNKMVELRFATALLSTGNYLEGWTKFEARLKERRALPITDLPIWDGTDLRNRGLIVICEGGYAETVQFCRVAGLVNLVFPEAKVTLVVADEMKPLLRTMRWSVTVIGESERWQEAAAWVPLLSIPAILKMDKTEIPNRVPYLRPDPTALAPWRERMGEGIKIAVAWHGNEPAFDDRERKIPLDTFEAIQKLDDVSLISVQKGEGHQDIDKVPFPIWDFNEDLDEAGGAFIDTLAILECCALVITVDSVIAHLAGALGKPVWVPLPAGQPDWRWAAEGRDTAWYPTMELFPADPHESWADLMTRLARRLEMMQKGLDPDELDKSLTQSNDIPSPELGEEVKVNQMIEDVNASTNLGEMDPMTGMVAPMPSQNGDLIE
ncbi:tetratricopeptide repeat protein [Curvivirga sp.]|uniref:tetratricopeptide repeat-containing glycosyltransferase family protein n=1 Tax=Curvivirga sp. TaxID=2856848 RepID=UPI003B5C7ABB